MKIKNMKSLFVKVLFIILLFTLININNCYAITSKEDIEEFKEYFEEYKQKEIKKKNPWRCDIQGCGILCIS